MKLNERSGRRTPRAVLALLAVAALLGGCTSVIGPEAAARLLDDKRRAAAAYQGGDYAEAAQRYRVLVREWPEEPDNWFLLGNSYVKLQQPEQALLAYREALVRDPSSSRAWYNVAYLQAEALGRTLVEMRRNVDPRDPAYVRINALVLQVLAPFGDEVLPAGALPAQPSPTELAPQRAAPEQSSAGQATPDAQSSAGRHEPPAAAPGQAVPGQGAPGQAVPGQAAPIVEGTGSGVSPAEAE